MVAVLQHGVELLGAVFALEGPGLEFGKGALVDLVFVEFEVGFEAGLVAVQTVDGSGELRRDGDVAERLGAVAFLVLVELREVLALLAAV